MTTERCPHGSGEPRLCSQCLGAIARRVEPVAEAADVERAIASVRRALGAPQKVKAPLPTTMVSTARARAAQRRWALERGEEVEPLPPKPDRPQSEIDAGRERAAAARKRQLERSRERAHSLQRLRAAKARSASNEQETE